MRRGAGPVAFGRPSSRRCASSTFFTPRQTSHSYTLIAERINGAGRNGTMWPLTRIGNQSSVANGMRWYSATFAASSW